MSPEVTPANGQYMIAAYVVAGVIYLVYALSLFVRARREFRNR